MFSFPFFVAKRYLFAKKTHNAINIVSGVSVMAIAVVTAALICVLSVMNGFEDVITKNFSRFDPQLRIKSTQGKSFLLPAATLDKIQQLSSIQNAIPTIEEVALIRYREKQMPALIKGVMPDFEQITAIDSVIVDGKFQVFDGAFERCVLGRGLANQIGIGAHFIDPIRVYSPKRKGRVNMLRPDKNFIRQTTFIAGIFCLDQQQYDMSYMLVSLDFARSLFDFEADEMTALEVQLTPSANIKTAKKELQTILGNDFEILDRYEQQADFFRIVKMEKVLTALLLFFILLIAGFNAISSLSMLILEKKEDIKTLFYLGANQSVIHRIFLYEGWLISILGAVIGTVLGLVVCGLQQHFGLLKLGSGVEYVLSAYPVSVQFFDVVIIFCVVLLMGYFCAYIPAKKVRV